MLTPGESVQQQNYLINSEVVFENASFSTAESLRYDSWEFDLTESVLLDTTILQDILRHSAWIDHNDNDLQDEWELTQEQAFTSWMNVDLLRDEDGWWNQPSLQLRF